MSILVRLATLAYPLAHSATSMLKVSLLYFCAYLFLQKGYSATVRISVSKFVDPWFHPTFLCLVI